MIPTSVACTATWVPAIDANRDLEAAAAAAVEWILDQAAREDVPPLLVTCQKDSQREGVAAIVEFADRYPATTLRPGRSGQHAVAGGRHPVHGPVLAFLPDYQAVDRAIFYARGSCLAVVEYSIDPLIGWAIETGALHLLTGRPTPDPRTDRQRQALEEIHRQGNNGWADSPGARDTARTLQELQRTEPLDADVIVGSMLARGHSHQSLRTLAKLIETATPAPGTTCADQPSPSSRDW